MSYKANELSFQTDMIEDLVANGWVLGTPAGYNRALALDEEDVVGFVKDTQPKEWEKYCNLRPMLRESFEDEDLIDLSNVELSHYRVAKQRQQDLEMEGEQGDLVNYATTIRDKVRENDSVMQQSANNTDEQAMLGDFPKAIDDAILGSSEAHQNQMFQLLSSPEKSKSFAKLIFEMLKMVG
jgi:type I restriction enzyme R subunit